jgi:hypothetical protein
MERKLIALVFIALLAGVGSGYASGYVIMEPQLSKLRSDVSTVTTETSNLRSQLNNSIIVVNQTVSVLNTTIISLNRTISILEQRLKVINDYYVWRANLTIPSGEILHITNATAGYKRVSVAWFGIGEFHIDTYFTIAGLDPRIVPLIIPEPSPINGFEVYEVKGTEINFKIWNLDTKTVVIDFAVYVVA